MVTAEQINQIAGWVRAGLRLDDLPNNSWNVNDPDTRAKIHCAVTGCETRGNALALTQVETEGALTSEPAMWQLEVMVATKDRRETRRQIPLCYEHAQVIINLFAKIDQARTDVARLAKLEQTNDVQKKLAAAKKFANLTPPRGTLLTPIRQFALSAKTDRFARIQNMLGETERLPAPPPAKFGLLAPNLLLGFLELLTLCNLPEDEHAYDEAYARYDELMK